MINRTSYKLHLHIPIKTNQNKDFIVVFCSCLPLEYGDWDNTVCCKKCKVVQGFARTPYTWQNYTRRQPSWQRWSACQSRRLGKRRQRCHRRPPSFGSFLEQKTNVTHHRRIPETLNKGENILAQTFGLLGCLGRSCGDVVLCLSLSVFFSFLLLPLHPLQM